MSDVIVMSIIRSYCNIVDLPVIDAFLEECDCVRFNAGVVDGALGTRVLC